MSTRWEVQYSPVYFEISEIEIRAKGRAPRIIYTALMYDRPPARRGEHVLLAQGWGVSEEAAMAGAMTSHEMKLTLGAINA
jgi:hypothetical protein